MSTSANEQETKYEIVVNGESHVDEELTAIESECKPQSSVTENAPSEAAKTESVSDWLVMICVFLCYVLNGINLTSYGVLYLSITEMFQVSRAAVGWIVSTDVALATFLGELNVLSYLLCLLLASLVLYSFHRTSA